MATLICARHPRRKLISAPAAGVCREDGARHPGLAILLWVVLAAAASSRPAVAHPKTGQDCLRAVTVPWLWLLVLWVALAASHPVEEDLSFFAAAFLSFFTSFFFDARVHETAFKIKTIEATDVNIGIWYEVHKTSDAFFLSKEGGAARVVGHCSAGLLCVFIYT